MGRELRRVPLDFDWPLGEVWHGYLSPSYRRCPDPLCDPERPGSTTACLYVEGLAYLIALMGEAASDGGRLHPWLQGIPVTYGRRRPGPDMAEWVKALAPEWSPASPFSDQHAIARALLSLPGLPEGWGLCPTCKGEGIHLDDLEAREAWKPTEPPKGEGYQLWETTSEGSPKSPVFATLDELCDYAAEHCSTFADHKATAEGWKHMLTDGFVAVTMEAGDGTRITMM